MYPHLVDIRLLVIDIAEKLGLVATAALVSVLVPPLRNRLLGIGGQPQDRFVALLLGFLLAMWGAKMGQPWMGVHVNFMAVGILMAALFQVGALSGLLGGLFYVLRIAPTLEVHVVPWSVLLAMSIMGGLGSWLARHHPATFRAWRAFPTACVLQLLAIVLMAAGHMIDGGSVFVYLHAWPALLVQVVSNAAGITLFVGVARVVLAREESAVALVEAQAASDQLALVALRRRLEPHFLFNALNTLRATIRVDPERARELVSDLSDLYRYLLRHPQDAPLEDEVEHACAYLAIERARLGAERLRVEREIATALRRVEVPALLLQPLVENSVKHGVAAHDGGGVVRVRARADGQTLVLEVEDESSGEHVGVLEGGTGIALNTLRERLHKRFGDAASLQLHPQPHGMCATIRIPLEEGGERIVGERERTE